MLDRALRERERGERECKARGDSERKSARVQNALNRGERMKKEGGRGGRNSSQLS